MKFPPLTLTATACAATLVFSQSTLPTVKAQPLNVASYRVQVQEMSARRTVSGLMITGHVINTGSKPLAYTKVMPMLEDRNGKTVYTGSGYLTVSPLQPGQAAEFRACEPNAPAFSHCHIAFREAGNPVLVYERPALIRQAAASRRGSGTE